MISYKLTPKVIAVQPTRMSWPDSRLPWRRSWLSLPTKGTLSASNLLEAVIFWEVIEHDTWFTKHLYMGPLQNSSRMLWHGQGYCWLGNSIRYLVLGRSSTLCPHTIGHGQLFPFGSQILLDPNLYEQISGHTREQKGIILYHGLFLKCG